LCYTKKNNLFICLAFQIKIYYCISKVVPTSHLTELKVLWIFELQMAELGRACTRDNPLLRPSMRSIVVSLMTLSSPTEDCDDDTSYENQTIINLLSVRWRFSISNWMVFVKTLITTKVCTLYIKHCTWGVFWPMKYKHFWDQVCPIVGHASMSDTNTILTTHIITLNYVIFSNYYRCQWIRVS
jgi:hypothetical protein